MTLTAFQNEVHQWAKKYVASGWSVVPLHSILENGACTCGTADCTNAGKHPRTIRGVHGGSRDLAQIELWFGPEAPLSNLGIVTGAISGLTVIDIDTAEGKPGAASWAEAIADHGEPVTRMARTGSGGTHVLFHYNSALKTASNVLGKGIDCRNDGGYIVVAPSRHRSGGVYAWVDETVPLASLPAHLSRRKETRGRPRKDDLHRGHYSIEQVRSMLAVVPAEDRDLWRHVGIILGRTFARTDEAWALYEEWSNTYSGKQGRNHREIMREAFYDLSQQSSDKELTIGTIVKSALSCGWEPKKGEVPLNDFVYYAQGNTYLYRPLGTQWVGAAVDAAVSPVNSEGKLTRPSLWLQSNQLATSLACDPLIDGDYVRGVNYLYGELVSTVGAAVFNLYRRSKLPLGELRLAEPFVNHVRRLLNKPGDADQFFNYMAHRVQRPGEKPRFALLMGGSQGIGKDTAITFCVPAIGAWNVRSIEPNAFYGAFNEYATATLVIISETANLQEMNKWAFNEQTKTLIAGCPDVWDINPKYGLKFAHRLHCGVILTTNHLTNGIYIPPDDRRYDVLSCATLEEMELEDATVRRKYFEELWAWFDAGGVRHVAAFLHARDLSDFSASGGQRKTAAHQEVVRCGMAGDEWAMDAIDLCENKDMISGSAICRLAIKDGEREEKVKHRISHALGRLGYVVYPNPGCKDGRWKIKGKLHKIFKLQHHSPEPGWEDRLYLKPLENF